MAATCTELLKAAIVGSAPAAHHTEPSTLAGETPPGDANTPAKHSTPEALLEALHADAQAALQDAAHSIAPEHQDAWREVQWEVFQEAHAAVQRLLLSLHTQAAAAGSATGALQAARCHESGLFGPHDEAAAWAFYQQAAELGSAEGCLRCGMHYFEGTAPGGRNGDLAFRFLTRAVQLAEAASPSSAADGGSTSEPASSGDTPASTVASSGGLGGDDSAEAHAELPALPPPSEPPVDGDLPPPLFREEVRQVALSWLGRCHLEGTGTAVSIQEAARCFRLAGDSAQLARLADLQRQFVEVDLKQSS